MNAPLDGGSNGASGPRRLTCWHVLYFVLIHISLNLEAQYQRCRLPTMNIPPACCCGPRPIATSRPPTKTELRSPGDLCRRGRCARGGFPGLGELVVAAPAVGRVRLAGSQARSGDRRARSGRPRDPVLRTGTRAPQRPLERCGRDWRPVCRSRPPVHRGSRSVCRGSLFQLLSIARTRGGEARLADWLKAPALPAAIRLRQEAVSELTTELDLREDVALAGIDVRAGVDPEPLMAWAEAAPFLHLTWLRLITVVVTAATIAALTLWGTTGNAAPLVVVVVMELLLFTGVGAACTRFCTSPAAGRVTWTCSRTWWTGSDANRSPRQRWWSFGSDSTPRGCRRPRQSDGCTGWSRCTTGSTT